MSPLMAEYINLSKFSLFKLNAEKRTWQGNMCTVKDILVENILQLLHLKSY